MTDIKNCYIMIGVPGSGKSTWGKKQTNAAYCSADLFFMKNGSYNFDFTKLGAAHGSCFKAFEKAIEDKQDVIVDNTNTRLKEIRPYYDKAIQNGYQVNLVFVKCDPEIAAARNLHQVPKEKVLEMHQRIQSLKIPDDWKVNIIEVNNE